MENITAKVSCFSRAFHCKTNTVRIFSDSAAELLLGPDYDKIENSFSDGIPFFLPGFTKTRQEGLRQIVDMQLSPSVLGRSAYCEKMLENEIRLGCRQYVIFASGYDTYAVRNCNTGLSVFELDLPDLIEDKKARIEKAQLQSSAVYVPADLSVSSWKDTLCLYGFSSTQKAFCSFLGITYYLEKADFRMFLLTLGDILCEGSAICLDYPEKAESKESKTNRLLAESAGEKMQSCFTYEEMEQLLASAGFFIYEHLDSCEMTHQYFGEYNRNNPNHTMKATDGVSYLLAVRKNMYKS